MPKEIRFTFLCDADERRVLAALAERLQRTQSDSVRWLIRNAATELQAAPTKAGHGQREPDHVGAP